MPTWEKRSEKVIQASGMISVQAECTLNEAVVLMDERATVSHQSLTKFADGVVERRIQFGI